MDTIAKILSFLMFPLFMPLYGVILLFNLEIFSFYPAFYMKGTFLTVVLLGILVPIFSLYILWRFGVISDFRVYKREDRVIPYSFTAIAYFFVSYMLYRLAMPLYVVNIAIGVAFATLVDAIVSLKWKISAHATGIGGLTSAVVSICYWTHANAIMLIVILFLAAGLLCAARLWLNRHTPAQLLLGFFNGFFSVLLFSFLNFGQFFRYTL